MALQTHRPVAGLKSYGRPARKTYAGYACEGGIHLLHKVPALVRRTGMPAAPLVVHKINHSAMPASKQSYTPTSIMRSQLASRGSDMSDSHMKKPDMRRGWGFRPDMCIAKSEEAHHTPHHHGARRNKRGASCTRDTAFFQWPKVLGKGGGGP